MRLTLTGDGRLGSRLVAVLAAAGLAATGTVAVTAGPAAAAVPALKIVSATVNADAAKAVYKTNAKTTRPKTRACTLNGEATGCGKLTRSTRRANTYTAKWSGLDDGAYRFRVSIKRTAAAGGARVTRIARFTVSTCTVTNTGTDTTTRGRGANLQTAINDATAGDILSVAGTCVGNYFIDKNLTVAGPANGTATLDGNGTGRVVFVNSGTVTLDNLTITGGKINLGGGIYNDGGAVSVTGSTIRNNRAGGGGIYTLGGTVTVTGSTIRNNTAADNYGGGILNDGGSVTVTDSTMRDNIATLGGGIYNDGGSVTVTDSSQITDNTATTSGNSGGGIYTLGGTVTVYYCAGVTISGNTPVDTSGPITPGICT